MPLNARAVRRFFQTPKGLLILLLAPMTVLAAQGTQTGWNQVGIHMAGTVALPTLIDLVILRVRTRDWEFPSGAILTGLIIAMILSPLEPWYVGASASIIALISKQLFRAQSANVFNPAAFGLVTTFFVFHPAQSWWGAMGEMPLPFVGILIATGLFIADRVNKIPLMQAFLGAYFLLFTITAFAGDPGHASAMFRAPNLHMALYFAFFILTDPPTSPVKVRDQIVCGVLIAVSSFVVFELVRSVYFLLAGALVGNVWDALRRRQRRRT